MNHQGEKKTVVVGNPTYVPLQQKCKGIFAGPSHSYAIADDKIFFWGKKHPCQIIIQENQQMSSKQNKQINNESLVTLPISVDCLSTGKSHTFAWNEKEVYCWGSNRYYQLGWEEQREYGVQKMQLFEKAIQNGYRLKTISCGQHHSLAAFHLNSQLQKNHKKQIQETLNEIYQKPQQQQQQNAAIQLFAWGQSQSYQLTINSLDIIPYPVLSPCTYNSLDEIYSKNDYNIALCNGQVYSWGCNIFSRLGQLIPSSQLPKLRIPKQVVLPEKIVKIGIGTYHVVAVAESGFAYSWGKGNQGQLGIDKFQAEGKPSKIICSEKIKDVCCGQSHTMVLLSDGRLKTCGSNFHGVLGHLSYDVNDKKKRAKKLDFVLNLQQVGEIVEICCGSSHNLILNKEGQVYGWGSNEVYQVLPQGKQKNDNSNKHPKVPRRQLQIKIDNQRQKNQKENGEVKVLNNCDLNLQKLHDWKRRYALFKEAKNRQQQIFMQELQQIMQLLEPKQIL